MSPPELASQTDRLASLDVFRGVTIAGMILVNNPGTWSHVYRPLQHAAWNGWTPTDLVFPFFLFIVGVAMALSIDRRVSRGQDKAPLVAQIVRRSLSLFALGLIMAGFPDWRLVAPYILVVVALGFALAPRPAWGRDGGVSSRATRSAGWAMLAGAVVYFVVDFQYFQQSHLRVPGVLQRIAVCYFCAGLIVLSTGGRGRLLCAVMAIAAYWSIMRLVSPPAGYTAPVTGQEGLLNDWIDARLLGAHLYRERPDPEGLLSTLPAMATTLFGVLAGNWLVSNRDPREKAAGLFVAANLALVAGLCMNFGFAINKKLWSPSYAVFTAGMALHFLAMCFWLVDIRGRRKWAWPFVVFGTNAIVVYFASGLMARLIARHQVVDAAGRAVALKTWLYEHLFASWAGALNGSLLFAVSYVVLWLALLLPLYWKRIYVRL